MTPMPDAEKEIEELEAQFPTVTGAAFAEARRQVLASGQSVLQVEDAAIYRVFPDGRKELVKPIEPPTRGQPGAKFPIR